MSRRGSSDGEDRFRVRPGAPRQRGDGFISRVLRQTSKAAGASGGPRRANGQRGGHAPGARLGRGHVAARFTQRSLTAFSRRATVKVRLVYLQKASPVSTVRHLRYIEREGVDRQGGAGRAYAADTDAVDTAAFEQRGREDRHQFRLIVSPEDAGQLDDLPTYTRHLMGRMEADLGTRLDWVAVDHWNTDNPHTHVVLRGKDDAGKDLIIARDYITRGMRERAMELATEWLGPRTEREIHAALAREVDQERWTGLDRTLQREAVDGLVAIERFQTPALRSQRLLLVGRLQRLQRMELATEVRPGTWAVHVEAEPTLRAMGERGDIIRTMQRAMGRQARDLAVFEAGGEGRAVIGRVAAKGLADELYDKGYLIVDGTDGKAHYVALPARAELERFPVGAVVEVQGAAPTRAADRTVLALAVDGVYRSDRHRALAEQQATPERTPQEIVAAHARRLEALRRAGVVERMAEGVWRVPDDLPERGRRYDAQRLGGGASIELKSTLPLDQQVRAIGATWLDQQLISGGRGLGHLGFGADVKDALRQRADFLVEQGLAQRRGPRLQLARNLLGTLRERDLATAAARIADETGLTHRPVVDGVRVSGVYRRSVQLASGRFAMLDDGMGFSLVPWKPVIEPRIGQTLAAMVRGAGVTWDVGRQRGLGVG